MKELRIRTLVGVFLAVGVLSWSGAGLWDTYGDLPDVPVAAPIVLGIIAAILLATALSVRSRLKAQRERKPDAKGVEPLMAARAVLFGQASALVAALVSGMYAGTGVFLLTGGGDQPLRETQTVYAGLSVVAGAAVVAAAVFLERICRLPDEDETPPSASPTA